MTISFGRPDQLALGSNWPLPLDRPFTLAQAHDRGISRSVIRRLERDGFLRKVLRGVYVAALVPDGIFLRARALSLVVPKAAVVTDRAAAWLLGVDILPPGGNEQVHDIEMFRLPGNSRVRREECSSGERMLRPQDVMQIEGVWVTTPLRTALDLGRLLPRDHAIGALDGLLRLGEFTHDDLLGSVERFRGFRGVVQLRHLAPLADPRSESPAEAVVRLRWHDSGLPRPEPQIVIRDARGREIFRIDLGLEEIKYGVEYNGVDYHGDEEAHRRDAAKLAWLDRDGWTIDTVVRDNVFGPSQDVWEILHRGVARARRRTAATRPRSGLRWPPLRGGREPNQD